MFVPDVNRLFLSDKRNFLFFRFFHLGKSSTFFYCNIVPLHYIICIEVFGKFSLSKRNVFKEKLRESVASVVPITLIVAVLCFDGTVLIVTVAAGVGIFLVISMLRIFFSISLKWLFIVSDATGTDTDAGAFCFSLPISEVAGLRKFDMEKE